MHRTDDSDNVSNLFDSGDPLIPRLPTVVGKNWLNAVQEELCNAVTDPGTALVKGTWTQLANALALACGEPGGRLCATSSGTPDPTADATSDALYYVPYKHNRIALYNGSRWEMKTIPDASGSPMSIPNTTVLTANKNFDLFAWSNAGTIALITGPAWTSDTARGTGAGTTELDRQDGRWVNKVAISGGPAAKRGVYVGTFRTNGSSFAVDTSARRTVWNMYNRVERAMLAALETANSWGYTSATIRQANANAANQLTFLVGLNEDTISARVAAMASVTGAGTGFAYAGIGLDSTSAREAACLWDSLFLNPANGAHGFQAPLTATWTGRSGIGFHFLAWLEQSNATGATFYGDNGSTVQSGISGVIRA